MNELNFFEPLLASGKKTGIRQRMIIYLTLFAVLLAAGSYGYIQYVIMEHKSLIAEYNGQLKRNESKRGEYDYQIKLLENKREYLSLLYTASDNDRITETISHIERSLPQELVISSIMISATGVNIQAFALSNADVAGFEYNLKRFELFETVHVNVINADGGYAANLSCAYKTSE